MRYNYTAMIPQTEVRRQAPNPQAWSIYNALSADELIALRAAGVSIRGRYVMSRTCPECGQPGEVGVTETTLADGIAFIARDGWTCRACRERETAHWVASPKPTPATSTPSGTTGQSHRRRSALRAQCSQRQRAITRWQQQYDGARATLDLIAAGLMPATLQPRMEAMLIEARHQLARLGIVLEVAS